jgi:alpha,alpha-trehalose-phosphate synthase [UDP-forming]
MREHGQFSLPDQGAKPTHAWQYSQPGHQSVGGMPVARLWDTMTDIERLLENRTLIVLSNREPYEHVRTPEGQVEVRQPPGGLVSALDPTMRLTHGVWVAWGSGDADADTTDADGRLSVPPGEASYTLRRVWLDEGDIEGFYLGFSNTALWPLCHMLVQHFEFRREHWERYKAVNRRFAAALADEARRSARQPLIWVQDYHFALVAAYLRELDPSLFVQIFWHIPFPPPDIWGLLPNRAHEALLRGLLGNDLIGFHTERHAQNFLACVSEFIPEAAVDVRRLTVSLAGRIISVGAFPISIDVDRLEKLARSPQAEREARLLRERYAGDDCQLGISVDRADYTKGIPQRLKALELLWEQCPELRGRFTMIIVVPPSRSELEAYRALGRDIEDTVMRINERFGTDQWTPLVLVAHNVDADLLAAVYRAADLCLISSLQDGMNLVAKEFIACQLDERGVLVLSRFAGAALETEAAVLINPFNVDGFMEGIRLAIEMPVEERRERMQHLRRQLHGWTIFDWLDALLTRAAGLMEAQPEPA